MKLLVMAASWSTIWRMEPRLGFPMIRLSRVASNFARTISVMVTTVAVIDAVVFGAVGVVKGINYVASWVFSLDGANVGT